MRLIGARCKHGDVFSQRILIGRGLFLRKIRIKRKNACCSVFRVLREKRAGVNGNEDPPVPIPNTEVKLIRVEDTWLETARENRSMPAQTQSFYSGFFHYVRIFFL